MAAVKGSVVNFKYSRYIGMHCTSRKYILSAWHWYRFQ
jgi:hypothetical protein